LSKRLLIVGAGPTQEPAIRRARAMGLEVAAADGDPHAPGLALAHHPLVVDILDVSAVLAAARRWRAAAVMTVGSDRAVLVAAEVAHALGLPGLGPQAAARASNKLLMREAFRAHGVPAPAFVPVRSLTEAEQAARTVGLPAVIKPVDNAAQRGVQRVDAMGQLAEALAEALRYSLAGIALVEECVEGPEITVSSFSLEGQMYPVLVADRYTNPPPYLGIALAHVFPSEQAEACWEQVVAITTQALDALGIGQGPGYTQLRVGHRGPQVMEVGARIGGGRETELINFLGGPDWMEAQVRMALGERVTATDIEFPDGAPQKAGVVWFLFVPPGEVVRVQGVGQARQLPGIQRVEVRARPGTRVPAMTSAEARQGYVIALGASRQEALDRAQAAAACVWIETRPTREAMTRDV
jgi:biotin carboxylase